ncbi:MAG: DNA-directed RNA polymerase subunit omega [Holosporaceae bacterium]|jgi:DNA-directed RNA polymerase subunit omega|nr:DNA-directed RNA polymerase subunit omega [Holosporaceae bacterium]
MARITIEDCERNVKNRFDLVILASRRTRQLLAGDKLTVPNEKNEKKPVVALREIAAGNLDLENLRTSTVNMFRSLSPMEDLAEDLDDSIEEDTYSPSVALVEGTMVDFPSNMSIISTNMSADDTDGSTSDGDGYASSGNDIADA